MRPADLAELARLTAAVSGAAEARLAALRRDEAALRARLHDLDTAQQARAREAQATDVTLRAGVDLRWEDWIEARRRALSAELARTLARAELARDDLRRAFGRKVAAEEIVAQVGRARRT
jgi:hypothetical protein